MTVDIRHNIKTFMELVSQDNRWADPRLSVVAEEDGVWEYRGNALEIEELIAQVERLMSEIPTINITPELCADDSSLDDILDQMPEGVVSALSRIYELADEMGDENPLETVQSKVESDPNALWPVPQIREKGLLESLNTLHIS